MDHTAAWTDKGRMRLSLVSVDLPISKSHLLVHHSPIFRLTTPPGLSGSFRVAPYEESESVLKLTPSLSTANEPTAPSPDSVSEGTKELVSKLRDNKRTTPMRNLPLRVAFPHFGPSLFLISELTSENQTPVVDLDFQRDKKRGDQ
jgi:hypothetical protein